MAIFTLNRMGGSAPYTISVKVSNDNTERFVSISGSTVTFTPKHSTKIEYYSVEVTDNTGCKRYGNFSFNCPYPCSPSPVISNVEITCGEPNTSVEFDISVSGGGNLIVDIGNQINGSFYHQTHVSGDTITTNIPSGYPSQIKVYKPGTEFQCFSSYALNPQCESEECEMEFVVLNTLCKTDPWPGDIVQISFFPSGVAPYTISIRESTTPDEERYISSTLPYVFFNGLNNGLNNSYTIIVTDSEGCQYSQIFTMTCGSIGSVGDCNELDVVLLLDDTGSIDDTGEWNKMITGVRSIVDSLKTPLDNGLLKMGIVRFGYSSLTPTPNYDVVLDTVLTSDYTTLINVVGDLSTGQKPRIRAGNTPTCNGLIGANSLIRLPGFARKCNKKIVLITDGYPTVYCNKTNGSLNIVAVKNNTTATATSIKTTPYVWVDNSTYSVRIITVGIGINSVEDNNWLKNDIASSPSEHFDTNFESFLSVADSIAEEICSS